VSFRYGTVCVILLFLQELLTHFKNRLDNFWLDQDILYDYKADLRAIGNRSVVY